MSDAPQDKELPEKTLLEKKLEKRQRTRQHGADHRARAVVLRTALANPALTKELGL